MLVVICRKLDAFSVQFHDILKICSFVLLDKIIENIWLLPQKLAEISLRLFDLFLFVDILLLFQLLFLLHLLYVLDLLLGLLGYDLAYLLNVFGGFWCFGLGKMADLEQVVLVDGDVFAMTAY